MTNVSHLEKVDVLEVDQEPLGSPPAIVYYSQCT